MRKPDRNTLPTTTHVLVVDGSKSPGSRFGGWACIHLLNQNLHHTHKGSLRTCQHSIDTEIEAILQAMTYSLDFHEHVTIISDCTPAIEKIVKQELPWGLQEIANLWMESDQNTILWAPRERLESQKLAHHLANSARIETTLQNSLEKITHQKTRKEKTHHHKKIKNLSGQHLEMNF